jgi:glycopeptide antibiotics resistance protein
MILIIIYVTLIVCLQVVPLGGDALNKASVGVVRADYFLHMLLFMPWMVLAVFRVGRGARGCWQVQRLRIGPARSIILLLVGLGLAVGAEALQHGLSYRAFNPIDALYNGIGVMLGGFVVFIASRVRMLCRL